MLLYAVPSAVYSCASVAGGTANEWNARTLGTVDCCVHWRGSFILVSGVISSQRTRVHGGVHMVALVTSNPRFALAFVGVVTAPKPPTDGEVLSSVRHLRRSDRLRVHEIPGNV